MGRICKNENNEEENPLKRCYFEMATGVDYECVVLTTEKQYFVGGFEEE